MYPSDEEPSQQAIADTLRHEITTGQLQPGQQIPSETTLAQTYGVATLTARAAHRILLHEGLIERRRGKGYVVRGPQELELIEAEPGSVIRSRMPTPAERDYWHISPGVPMIVVVSEDGIEDAMPADRFEVRVPRSDG